MMRADLIFLVFLDEFAKRINKTRADLVIYDPYYCGKEQKRGFFF
jgi:hypothetical protein